MKKINKEIKVEELSVVDVAKVATLAYIIVQAIHDILLECSNDD